MFIPILYVCNDNLKGSDLYVTSSSIIFKVLSQSTELYDKDVKLKYYKRIKSLNYYVLVAQKEIRVEVYSRIDDTEIWKYQTFEMLN